VALRLAALGNLNRVRIIIMMDSICLYSFKLAKKNLFNLKVWKYEYIVHELMHLYNALNSSFSYKLAGMITSIKHYISFIRSGEEKSETVLMS
jgi:hypothetical protein